MGYDAGQQFAALEYDFTTIHGLELMPDEIQAALKDAKGVVPEPSQQALDRFREAAEAAITSTGLDLGQIAEIAKFAEREEEPSEAEMLRIVGKLPDNVKEFVERARAAQRAHIEAAVEVCGGSPSAEVFEALPGRHREGFTAYLTGELLRPTRPTPASRPSPVAANGAAPTTA